MTLTKDQRKELESLSAPLMDWLDKNFHPHITIILDGSRCEILEGIAMVSEAVSEPLVESSSDEPKMIRDVTGKILTTEASETIAQLRFELEAERVINDTLRLALKCAQDDIKRMRAWELRRTE